MDLVLFVLGFIGMIVFIVLLILNAIKKKPKKKALIGLSICFILIIAGFAIPSVDSNTGLDLQTDQSSEVNVSEPEDISEVNIKYKILEKEDISIANAVRHSYKVLVPEDLSENELKNISKKIINDESSKEKVNAINLFFYDNENDIGTGGYTVGKVEWAPYGDWGRAMEVEKGNYSSHEYKYDFKVKNLSEKPSDKEIEIYNFINSELNKPENPSKEETPQNLSKEELDKYMEDFSSRIEQYEQNVNKMAANKFGKTVEEINKIYIKVFAYKHN